MAGGLSTLLVLMNKEGHSQFISPFIPIGIVV